MKSKIFLSIFAVAGITFGGFALAATSTTQNNLKEDLGQTESSLQEQVTANKIALQGLKELQGTPLENTQLADNVINSSKVENGTLGSDDLAVGSVGSSQLANSSVTSIIILDGTILNADIANGTISSAKFAPGAVDSASITDGSVTAKKLQSAATDLGAADVNVNISNANGSFNTNITTDGTMTATTFTGALTGNATSATALAVNPTDCAATNFATTIAANGNLTCAAITDADVPNTITIDLATAATALAVNPTDCAATNFATTIAANGNLTCAAITDADVPNTITIDLATAATALAVNPTDCAATNFATTIAANGNLTCAAITDADVPNTITIDLANTVTTNANLTGIVTSVGNATSIANGAITATKLQSAATDLGGANVTIDLSNTNVGGFNTNITTDGTMTATTFFGALTGNAATATALAANPADCVTATHFATGIDASGVPTCEAIADADVPDSITVTLAATATALAANPADCVTATHFATGIDASGVPTCEAIADADVPDDITINNTGDTTLGSDGADTLTVNAETVFASTGNISFAPQIINTGNVATFTLPTITSSYVLLQCNRAAAADTVITMSETGARDGQIVMITIDGEANNAGSCSWADQAGIQQISADVDTAADVDDFDGLNFIYENQGAVNQWVLISNSNN